jgi:hypothetical protein
LAGGYGLGALSEAFGAEQLAADGPGEAVLAGIRSEQRSEEGEGSARAQRDGEGPVVSRVIELLGEYNGGYWLLAMRQILDCFGHFSPSQ